MTQQSLLRNNNGANKDPIFSTKVELYLAAKF